MTSVNCFFFCCFSKKKFKGENRARARKNYLYVYTQHACIETLLNKNKKKIFKNSTVLFGEAHIAILQLIFALLTGKTAVIATIKGLHKRPCARVVHITCMHVFMYTKQVCANIQKTRSIHNTKKTNIFQKICAIL